MNTTMSMNDKPEDPFVGAWDGGRENSNAGLRRPGGMLLVMNEGETCCLVRRSWCVRGIPAHCRRAGFSTPTTNLVSLAAKGTKSLPLHACAMQAYCPRTQSSQRVGYGDRTIVRARHVKLGRPTSSMLVANKGVD